MTLGTSERRTDSDRVGERRRKFRVEVREQQSGLGQPLAIDRGKQAEVANLDEAIRKDVLQETADELLGRESATLALFSFRFLVSESDMATLQTEQAAIAEGDTEDIRSQIF